MDNNDFLAAIEKGKERLTDANRSKEDYWFNGSMVLLEACLVEVWNTAKKDTIPIEWVRKYIKDHTQRIKDPKYDGWHFTEEPLDYYVTIKPYQVEEMLKTWEEENGILRD